MNRCLCLPQSAPTVKRCFVSVVSTTCTDPCWLTIGIMYHRNALLDTYCTPLAF